MVLEQQRLEYSYKMTIKAHKKAQQKQGDKSLQMDENQGNKIDLFLLSRQVDELCNQINDCGIPTNQEILKGLGTEASN